MKQEHDAQLWETAKQRAAFKRSLLSYFLVNTFLVIIWYLTSYRAGHYQHFWPIWPMLGWGLGLAFQYVQAYHRRNFFSAQKEYEALKQKQEGNG
ncbi:MAG TPA: 2TM domain-containing protein [Phnomibacter sp.]|nr:2TM domain-containing protein [Phnomibacter sp.]